MESDPITLFEYLTQPNPTLLCAEPCNFSPTDNTAPKTKQKDNKGRSCSTASEEFPVPKDVKLWKDFSLETVRKLFEGQLGQSLEEQMDGPRDEPTIHTALLSIYDEDALESLLGKWHQSVVLEALNRTSSKLLKQDVAMVKGGQAVLLLDKSHKFAPDWAGVGGIPREDNVPKPSNILPGETKCSWVWQSSWIKKHRRSRSYENEGVLRQLLNYCLLTYSRYGYIITDKELVAVRVSCEVPKGSLGCDQQELKQIYWDSPIVEYRAIPWTSTGQRSMLTMNLALWALHILAANNGHIQSSPYCELVNEVLSPKGDGVPVALATSSFDKHQPLSFESTYQPNEVSPASPEQDAVLHEHPGEDDTESDEDEDPIVGSANASFDTKFIQETIAEQRAQRGDRSRAKVRERSNFKVVKAKSQPLRASSSRKRQKRKAE